MSLKAFHIFFIAVSSLLAVIMAVWFFNGGAGEQWRLAGAGLSIAAGTGMVLYGRRFLAKFRHVGALLVVLASSPAAHACAVCYGITDEKSRDALNLSILAMIGVTGGVLVAFAVFFIILARRARRFEKEAESHA